MKPNPHIEKAEEWLRSKHAVGLAELDEHTVAARLVYEATEDGTLEARIALCAWQAVFIAYRGSGKCPPKHTNHPVAVAAWVKRYHEHTKQEKSDD